MAVLGVWTQAPVARQQQASALEAPVHRAVNIRRRIIIGTPKRDHNFDRSRQVQGLGLRFRA